VIDAANLTYQGPERAVAFLAREPRHARNHAI
jgi:hypothetical protein